MNSNFKRISSFLLAILLAFSLIGCDVPDVDNSTIDKVLDFSDAVDRHAGKFVDVGGTKDSKSTDDDCTTSYNGEYISITALDVGQGLSVLIESDGECMLYDGGDRGTSSYVVSYLEKHGVNHLEYMIASHYDSDHLAGLVGVLETTSVDTVINPDFKATTKIYESYVAGRDASGANVIYPSVGDIHRLGDATFTILAPARDYGDANEISVAIKIELNDFSCVITGDAEGESESDMVSGNIDLGCDLYVVGHHGSSSSSSDAFVRAMNPEFAFISCGAGNDYGHPTEQTLNTLAKYDIDVYRTDLIGELNCYYDGDVYINEAMYYQLHDNNETVDIDCPAIEYVLNISSMKFHLPDCEAIEKMSEKNKEIAEKSREELINEGYVPCGICDP